MPQNSNRWQRLAAELADERDRPPSVRKGRMARAKRRARLEAEAAGQGAQETHSPSQEPPDGKPGGKP